MQYQQHNRRNNAPGPPPLARPLYVNGAPSGIPRHGGQPGMGAPPMVNGAMVNGHTIPMTQGPGPHQAMGYAPGPSQPNGMVVNVGSGMPNPGIQPQGPMVNNAHPPYMQTMRPGVNQPGQPPRQGMPGPQYPSMSQAQAHSTPNPSYQAQGTMHRAAGNPPNAPSPLGPNPQTPQSTYAPLGGGRPASRSGGPETPRSATHPSPSITHRAPPQQQQQQMHQPQHQLPPQPQQQPPPMDDSMRQLQLQHNEIEATMANISQMSPANITNILQQAGLPPNKPLVGLQFE